MIRNEIVMFGYAKNASGKIEQVRAMKITGLPITQEWTGKLYKNEREAATDVATLNIEIAKERRSFERMMSEA